MRGGVALLCFAAGCGGPRTLSMVAPEARTPRSAAASVDAFPTPSREAVWHVSAAGPVAGEIFDVGALSGGDAVLLGGRTIALWTPSGIRTTPCPRASEGEPFVGVQTDGDRFVVAAGHEGHVTLWISRDRGGTCARMEAPSLALRDTEVGRVGFALHGTRIHLWSTGGSVFRSEDLGQTWRRLPVLRGVSEVAPGPGRRVLAAAVLGTWGARRRLALYALSEEGGPWEAVPGAGHLRSPVTIGTATDDGVLVGDGAGVHWIAADLSRVERRVDWASRDEHHAPAVLADAGDGSFLASTGTVLLRVERHATTVRAALRGARPIRAIDAAPDGWSWVTDGRGLWRARGEGPLEAVWSPPLHGEEPRALAVRDGRVLVAGSGRAVALREGMEGPWRALDLPEGLGRPVAAHIDARGGLFVLTSNGLAVSDALRFVAVEAPAVPSRAPALVAALGDRWFVAAQTAWVRDMPGGRWEPCFGDANTPPREARSEGDAGRRVALAHALVDDAVMTLDANHTVFRGEVIGQRFERVGELPAASDGGRRTPANPLIAWDGAARVAVLAGELYTSLDGGVTFSVGELPFVPRWASWVDGTLVATGALSPLLPVSCRDDPRQSLFVQTPAGWVPDPEACEQRGTLAARDGDDLWLIDEALTLRRATLSRLLRSVLRR